VAGLIDTSPIPPVGPVLAPIVALPSVPVAATAPAAVAAIAAPGTAPAASTAPAAAAATRRRARGRRRQQVQQREYAHAFMDLEVDPDRDAPMASDRGAGSLGFAGTVAKGSEQAAGLATLPGDDFGGGPSMPMLPHTWWPEAPRGEGTDGP
jgi:PPE-repeat protein